MGNALLEDDEVGGVEVADRIFMTVCDDHVENDKLSAGVKRGYIGRGWFRRRRLSADEREAAEGGQRDDEKTLEPPQHRIS